MNPIITLLSTVILIYGIGCSRSVKKDDLNNSFSNENKPEYIYLQSEVRASVDSLSLLYQKAVNALNMGDTIGARIYYDKIFSVIAEYDEETKSVLLEWDAYNILLRKINHDYETVFAPDLFDQEAEEVREELTDYEEEAFGDTSGIQSTRIDSITDEDIQKINAYQRTVSPRLFF